MTPHRHPSQAILTDYASGALRSAFSTVVAAHLEHCAHCRDEVAQLEAVGGALIEDLSPAPMREGSLDKVMAALDATAPARAVKARPTMDRVRFGTEWGLSRGMGIRKAKDGAGGELLYLLRLPAGQKTLPHGHRGVEYTTVLKGAYNDNGELYAQGDFCEMDPSIEHQPHVVAEGECICLIASEKPMRMTSRLGRVVQGLIGV